MVKGLIIVSHPAFGNPNIKPQSKYNKLFENVCVTNR